MVVYETKHIKLTRDDHFIRMVPVVVSGLDHVDHLVVIPVSRSDPALHHFAFMEDCIVRTFTPVGNLFPLLQLLPTASYFPT